jgi:hypothetical protein
MLIGLLISIIGLLIVLNTEKVTKAMIHHVNRLTENTSDKIKRQLEIKSTKKVKIIVALISFCIITIGILLIIGVNPNYIVSNVLLVLGLALIIFEVFSIKRTLQS